MSRSPELYAILETGAARADAASAALDALLTAHPVASVLLRPASGTIFDASLVKTLVTRAQKQGVAVLIADDANLARMVKADGLHVSWSKDIVKDFRAAREVLGERAMIGADAGRSRDDAMQLGEDGADYVAFGIPAHVEDRATAEDRQLNLIDWWSEIFEVPCVAFDVASAEYASAIARQGADFIAVTVSANDSADAIARTIKAFAAAAATPVEASA